MSNVIIPVNLTQRNYHVISDALRLMQQLAVQAGNRQLAGDCVEARAVLSNADLVALNAREPLNA